MTLWQLSSFYVIFKLYIMKTCYILLLLNEKTHLLPKYTHFLAKNHFLKKYSQFLPKNTQLLAKNTQFLSMNTEFFPKKKSDSGQKLLNYCQKNT